MKKQTSTLARQAKDWDAVRRGHLRKSRFGASSGGLIEFAHDPAYLSAAPHLVAIPKPPVPSVSKPATRKWFQQIRDSLETEDAIAYYELDVYAPESLRDPAHIDVHGFVLCGELDAIARKIEQSKRMLALEDNWDGEGSPGYAEATWREAVEIVVESANSAWLSFRRRIPVPAISEGPDGSIDVTWRSGTRQVLINVPPAGEGPTTFSGLDASDKHRTVKGRIGASKNNEWLLEWLMT